MEDSVGANLVRGSGKCHQQGGLSTATRMDVSDSFSWAGSPRTCSVMPGSRFYLRLTERPPARSSETQCRFGRSDPARSDRIQAFGRTGGVASASLERARFSTGSSHFCRAAWLASTDPIRLAPTGRMPTKRRMLRCRFRTLWAPKYQRYTNAGMPMVTTMRAVLPERSLFHPMALPDGEMAKPRRKPAPGSP